MLAPVYLNKNPELESTIALSSKSIPVSAADGLHRPGPAVRFVPVRRDKRRGAGEAQRHHLTQQEVRPPPPQVYSSLLSQIGTCFCRALRIRNDLF